MVYGLLELKVAPVEAGLLGDVDAAGRDVFDAEASAHLDGLDGLFAH